MGEEMKERVDIEDEGVSIGKGYVGRKGKKRSR